MSDADADAGSPTPQTPVERAMPEPGADEEYDAFVAREEQRLAEQRASSIAAGKRRAGLPGAAMAGAMLAVAEIYEGPPKDDAPVTVEASGDPNDIDRDGVDVTVGDVDVAAPPLERIDPVGGDERKRPQV